MLPSSTLHTPHVSTCSHLTLQKSQFTKLAKGYCTFIFEALVFSCVGSQVTMELEKMGTVGKDRGENSKSRSF